MRDDTKYYDFTDLDIWKLSHELRLKVKVILQFLPVEEKFN